MMLVWQCCSSLRGGKHWKRRDTGFGLNPRIDYLKQFIDELFLDLHSKCHCELGNAFLCHHDQCFHCK